MRILKFNLLVLLIVGLVEYFFAEWSVQATLGVVAFVYLLYFDQGSYPDERKDFLERQELLSEVEELRVENDRLRRANSIS